MEKVSVFIWTFGTYYGHFWYMLRLFGNLVAMWYFFPQFWYLVSSKLWQPCSQTQEQTVFRM
jgi:hypothetical protein